MSKERTIYILQLFMCSEWFYDWTLMLSKLTEWFPECMKKKLFSEKMEKRIACIQTEIYRDYSLRVSN